MLCESIVTSIPWNRTLPLVAGLLNGRRLNVSLHDSKRCSVAVTRCSPLSPATPITPVVIYSLGWKGFLPCLELPNKDSSNPTMCLTAAYKSRFCHHRWLTITRRCGPTMGFTSTPIHEFYTEPFSTSTFSSTPKFLTAPAGTCPSCDLQGRYDENTTRMVLWSGERELRKQTRRARRRGELGWSTGGAHAAPRFYASGLGYEIPSSGVDILPRQTMPIARMATTNDQVMVVNKGQDQTLTPYQHAFAVNQAAQANASLQYRHMAPMPVAQRYQAQPYERTRCSLM